MDKFTKITNKAYAFILTALFITTLIGIITKKAYWHIPTLIFTGSLAVVLWLEKGEEPKDNSPI